MFDFTKLWNKIYLFGPNPQELTRSDVIFFWIAVVFVLVGIASKIFSLRNRTGSPHRYLLNRCVHLFFTIGILVLVWVGARRENIPWIVTHFLVLLLFLIWLIWFGFIIAYFFGRFQQDRKIWKNEQIKNKYLKNQ